MLKTRGGHRFEGYGNVKVATNHGTRVGWQLTCSECKTLSDVIHRAGSSFPPKVLTRLFSEKGWKVGNTSEADVCPGCLEKRRQKHKEERKQYAKGNVDRLLDLIRQVDLMLASNVTVEYGPYQPQIAAQLKSLFETAFLCNMLTTPEPLDLLRSREQALEAALNVAKAEYAELKAERDELLAFDSDYLPPEPPDEERTLHLSPEPDPPPASPAPPPPAPPAPEGERISPRTAAFLAEVRKQVFKGAAA
jgi:hypothetical protein